jgi:hypothetical protein
MGTWGVGTFDNDDAVDWLAELQATDDEAVLQAALEAADDGEDYLEAPEGARILCACELVAASIGQAASDLPEKVREWMEQHPALDMHSLIPMARNGIDRVLAADSELEELWRENADEYPAWRENVLTLKARLGMS